MRRHSKGSIPRLCAEETSGTSLVARCLLWQGTGYGEFQRGEMVCTKTLYNYVTLGLLGKIKSIDLPLRVKRKKRQEAGS